jgi:hypothetical protein
MVKVVQNNQNLQILFALQFPIRFSLKKYPSEMRSNHPKALLFYHFVRKIIHQLAETQVAQAGRLVQPRTRKK